MLWNDLAGVVWGCNLLQTRLHAPDLTGVLGDGAVAGEFATTSYVVDDHLGPFFSILFENEEEEQVSSQFLHCFFCCVLKLFKALHSIRSELYDIFPNKLMFCH